MTTAPDTGTVRPERRSLYLANLASAILGGLSLLLAVSAPFAIGMSAGGSFTDVMVTACVCGGFPLMCWASIGCSRWLLERGTGGMVGLIAIMPLLLFCTLLLWAAASG